MKVVHVTSSLDRAASGIREVVFNLARCQQALGLDVSVLSLDCHDWSSEVKEWAGISVHLLPVIGPRSFGYARNMSRALEEIGPDIVHQHGLWMHPGRSVLQWHKATGQPYVVSPHGMLSEVALSYGALKKK